MNNTQINSNLLNAAGGMDFNKLFSLTPQDINPPASQESLDALVEAFDNRAEKPTPNGVEPKTIPEPIAKTIAEHVAKDLKTIVPTSEQAPAASFVLDEPNEEELTLMAEMSLARTVIENLEVLRHSPRAEQLIAWLCRAATEVPEINTIAIDNQVECSIDAEGNCKLSFLIEGEE